MILKNVLNILKHLKIFIFKILKKLKIIFKMTVRCTIIKSSLIMILKVHLIFLIIKILIFKY